MSRFLFQDDGDPHAHPAVKAWATLNGRDSDVIRVEVLTTRRGKSPNRKSTIYRLGFSSGNSVIAKHAAPGTLAVERVIYQEILPLVPVDSLYCHGMTDVGEDRAWLFLEEAKGARFDEESAEHRSMATNWLATLHTMTSSLDLTGCVPSHGPDRYHPCLLQGITMITQCLANPALNSEDLGFLKQTVVELEGIAQHWRHIETYYETLPKCLVHGDFVGKNVYVITASGVRRLSVMDWDIAGWGSPAVDMERISLAEYLEVSQSTWPGIKLRDLEDMAGFGAILRNVGLVQATSLSLGYDWVEEAMRDIRLYQRDLMKAYRQFGSV